MRTAPRLGPGRRKTMRADTWSALAHLRRGRLQLVRDRVEDRVHLLAGRRQRRNADECDQRDEQCIFDQVLALVLTHKSIHARHQIHDNSPRVGTTRMLCLTCGQQVLRDRETIVLSSTAVPRAPITHGHHEGTLSVCMRLACGWMTPIAPRGRPAPAASPPRSVTVC